MDKRIGFIVSEQNIVWRPICFDQIRSEQCLRLTLGYRRLDTVILLLQPLFGGQAKALK